MPDGEEEASVGTKEERRGTKGLTIYCLYSSRAHLAAATMLMSAASTSGQARVLSPQSGLTTMSLAWGMASRMAAIFCWSSSWEGTRGEWMS